MATKASETTETTESREETGDRPLMDANSAPFKKMLQRAKERGYVTYDELNQFLPQDKLSSEQIEDSMAALSEMGITVIENEEPDDTSNEEEEETPVRPTGNLDDEDIGRTDDPVRMYLREMGSVELLSREGEIAIAKRIEAGREKMIGGICESPLTIRALLAWRAALLEGKILLRDIIDLDATYAAEPGEAELAGSEGVEAEPEDNGDDTVAASDGQDGTVGEGQDGAAGEDGGEETSLSLAAMEQMLLPQVVETFDQIATSYKKLSRAQDKRLGHLQKGEQSPKQSEIRYEKLKHELIDAMKGVRLNNARIEQLVEKLYELNKRLLGLEGRLLRLATESITRNGSSIPAG